MTRAPNALAVARIPSLLSKDEQELTVQLRLQQSEYEFARAPPLLSHLPYGPGYFLYTQNITALRLRDEAVTRARGRGDSSCDGHKVGLETNAIAVRF